MEFLKRLSVPVVALLYVLAFIAQLHDYSDRLGWRLVAVGFFAVTGAWAAWVWSSKELTTVEPRTLRSRFRNQWKWVAVLPVVAAAGPVWFALQPVPPFSVPALLIKLSNKQGKDVTLGRFGEFYLTALDGPLSETQVASGRLRMRATRAASESLVVAPGSGLDVLAEFLNPSRLQPMLARGDLSLRVIVFQQDGAVLTKAGIPFTEETLRGSYIVFETR